MFVFQADEEVLILHVSMLWRLYVPRHERIVYGRTQLVTLSGEACRVQCMLMRAR